jgi:hypothetical protein
MEMELAAVYELEKVVEFVHMKILALEVWVQVDYNCYCYLGVEVLH